MISNCVGPDGKWADASSDAEAQIHREARGKPPSITQVPVKTGVFHAAIRESKRRNFRTPSQPVPDDRLGNRIAAQVVSTDALVVRVEGDIDFWANREKTCVSGATSAVYEKSSTQRVTAEGQAPVVAELVIVLQCPLGQ